MGQLGDAGFRGTTEERFKALGEKLVEVAKWPKAERDIKELMSRTDVTRYAGVANYNNNAPVRSAIAAHTYENLKTLVNYGADLDRADPGSIPPLFGLARGRGAEGVHVFRELGANMNIKDGQGKDAYFYTTDPETIVALARNGVKADPARNGDTPLTRMTPENPNINLMAVYSAAGYTLPESLKNVAASPEHKTEFDDLQKNYRLQMGFSQPVAAPAPVAPAPAVGVPRP